MDALFVMACKFDPANPIVLDCVDSIRRHHPDAAILVVDSDSEDRSYIPVVEKMGAHVSEIDNRRYVIGAFAHAWRTMSGYEQWYLIHDSIVLNAPLPEGFGTVRWFSDPPHGWGWDEDGIPLSEYGSKVLASLGLECPSTYRGVLGPMWWCEHDLMRRLDELGFFDVDVRTKCENSAMERVTGIVLEHLGMDILTSLQGPHRGHFDCYDESVVTKHYQNRT